MCALRCSGLLLGALLVASTTSHSGMAAPQCPSPDTGVPAERIQTLARGFNLPGWVSGATQQPPSKTTLRALRKRGLTHIRLPVTAERLMDSYADPRETRQQLEKLDLALDTLLELGFGISLDVHPGERLGRLHKQDSDEGFRRINALWSLLARRYARHSADRLFLEVLNEPSVPARIWNEQGPRLVRTIRQEAPRHTIIYGPADYQHIDALSALKPLTEQNIVYAVHFYEPMIFTHQGLNWSDDPLRHLAKVPFPATLSDPPVARLVGTLVAEGRGEAAALLKSGLRSPWTEERVRHIIARAANWARVHSRPVIINEFGVLAWKADPADRARWIATVRRAAESNCLGWTHWDYADGFGFVHRVGDREFPDPRMLNALVGNP